ncbi:hypothetical protein [Gracilimonas sp.]|uniref:hypothetical protein n=1 Tax=Gracilimonas sp. TaxID=1974203 RepID=UPI003D0FCB2F
MKFLSAITLFLLSVCLNVNAQMAVTAVPFLEIRPDAQTNMNAGALVALPSDYNAAFYYNPAQLGNFGASKNFSYQFHPNGNNWLPDLNDNPRLYNSSLAAGYKFNDVPLSIGVGVMNTRFDYGEIQYSDPNNPMPDSTYNPVENYQLYSVGLRYDFGILVSIGYSFKKVDSDLGLYQAKVDASDFGIQIGYPFSINSFKAEASIGYALQNDGDFIQYDASVRPDPLPRKSIFGYGLSLAYEDMLAGNSMELVKIDWAVDAKDLRIDVHGNSVSYNKKPGIIPMLDNVFLSKSDDDIEISQGFRLHILEGFTAGLGRYYGPGYRKAVNTSGVSLSAKPILKLLFSKNEHPVIRSVANHLDFSYSWSTYSVNETDHPLTGSSFHQFSISVYGF